MISSTLVGKVPFQNIGFLCFFYKYLPTSGCWSIQGYGPAKYGLSSGQTVSLLNATLAVLTWGKVTTGNVDWARRHAEDLRYIYQKGMSLLDPKIADDRNSFTLRFNSGFSKIYSLLLDDFIIYDSRVGGALGHLVIQYCQSNQFESVPLLLQFPWAPAKETNPVRPKNRNPSTKHLILKKIDGSQEHALWNLRASWLLKEAAGESELFSKLTDPIRALEAALFMIGYDLDGEKRELQAEAVKSSRSKEVKTKGNYPLTTHGRGYPFRVDFDSKKEALIFSYPRKSNDRQRAPDKFTLNDIQNICLYLEKNFGPSAFPLANNVEYLNYNREKPGLGMAIRTLPETVPKAQAASYLGPYMERIGVFELVSPWPAKWKMIVRPCSVIPLIRKYHQNKTGNC